MRSDSHAVYVAKKRFRTGLWYVIMTVFVGFIVFPFYWMIKTSLEPNSALFKYPVDIFPQMITMDSYFSVFTERDLPNWFKNSSIVTLIVTLTSMALASLSAYSISRFRNRINILLGFVILITQMLPGTLFILPIYQTFKTLNLMDTLFGVIIAYTTFTLPIAIWMLKGYFDSIPIDLEEAARIDGASRMRTIGIIVIPLALPGYMATAIFALLNSWNEYLFGYMLLTSQSNWLLSTGLATFKGEYTTPWNWIMAAATMYTLPPVIAFVFMQKYLISGLTAGAIKS